jgi:hypothetical protein
MSRPPTVHHRVLGGLSMRFRSIALAWVSPILFAACTDVGRIVAPTPKQAAEPSFEVGGEPCDPRIQICDEPPGGGGSTPDGIALGFSEEYCRVATPGTLPDADGDGINDTCEYELAAAFAPMLVQQSEYETGWPGGPDLPVVPGEYLFAVGAGNAGYAARLAYLPAYYKDLGNSYTGGSGHSGDSEFIMVDLAYNTQTARWYTVRVFLSSHCGAYDPVIGFFEADPNCQWYHRDNFEYVNGVRFGAPVVWVSDFKHSNYTSFAHCHGGTAIDRCDNGPRYRRRFPIGPASEILPAPNTNWIYRSAQRASAPLIDPEKTEMFADVYYRPFNGWQATSWGDPSTPYGDILERFGIIRNSTGWDQGTCNTTQLC